MSTYSHKGSGVAFFNDSMISILVLGTDGGVAPRPSNRSLSSRGSRIEKVASLEVRRDW